MQNHTWFAERRERLRRLMAREGLDALLVSHPANRYYLSGFELHDGQCNESSGCLLLTRGGQDWLCTDSRYEEAAAGLWERERVFLYQGSPAEDVRALIRDKVSGTTGFEAKILSWDYVRRIEPGLTLREADGLVEELRVIKDDMEIARLERSVRLNHDMLAWLPSILTAGRSEADIAWAMEKYYRENGASENSFPPIVAKDAHAALPHYRPDKPAVLTPNCHVLVDQGARVDQYCSDQTRTFWVGDKPSDRFLKVLESVREAQRRAIAHIRPGVSGREVHQVAVDFFASRGQEKAFTHSLGHGVGLETHEEPRLSPRSTTKLRPGMIVTVEPGLYYPGWGGARWEYMVLVTEDGCRVL
ncbi:MAG: aminopeptidase P family protein [Desulfovibrionaceae bacterium]|nr:aminopeptidase P family protein [Desulfovibrionaceae bacterium]